MGPPEVRAEDAFFALPPRLAPPCAQAWRLLVAQPPRSRALALEACAEGAEPSSHAWAQLCLAHHQTRSGEGTAAAQGIASSLAAFERLGDDRGRTLAEVTGAYLHITRGEFDRAVATLEAALETYARAERVAPLDYFLATHGLALALGRQGRLERVLQLHYGNLLLLEQSGSPTPLAVVLLNLSSTLTSIDDWEEALELALRAVRCCERFDNAALKRRAEINVALALRFLGRLDEALALLARLRAEPFRDPGSDFALFINSAEAHAHRGEVSAARELLERARACAQPAGDTHERANLAWVAGLAAARAGETAAAIERLEEAKRQVLSLEKLHVPLLPRIVEVLAACYAGSGEPARAFETFREFHDSYQARLGYTTRARYSGRQSRLGVAAIESTLWSGAGGNGDRPAEHARLSQALSRTLDANDAPPEGLPGWSPRSIARIAAEAHGLGVESRHVGGLMENLLRAPDATSLESPAQTVRVHVLGAFEIAVAGAPLKFGRKRPERPLTLLKYLAAHGSRAAPEVEVADAIWPDLEGDAALRALAVNLHRLRHLLGGADTISHQGRALALNTRRVWCDAALFEWLLDRAAADEEARESLTAQAIHAYRGDLVVDEDRDAWAIGPRRRLRARFVAACAALGTRLAAADKWDEACASFARGLERDPAAEELCLGIMRACLALERPEQGIAAYRRFGEAMAEQRRPRPAAIEALYGELLARAR